MSIEIKSRRTGDVIKTVEADTLQDADLTGADLAGADLRGAYLWGADLTCANLMGANLTCANLMGANLTDADLRSADLTGADLTGADLTGADLWGANLTGANLTGANLRGAKRHMDGDTAITLVGQRPILQIGPLGSRDGYMLALITSAGVRVECGCFCGTVAEFKAKVEKNHADNPRHRDEYLAVIRMINAWAMAEMKYIAAWEAENGDAAGGEE